MGVVETIVLFLGCALGLVCLWEIRGHAAEQEPASGWRTTGWAIIGFLLLSAVYRGASPFLVSGDEYHRLQQAVAWAQSPFFATADHVYLPGQFYILGSLFYVFGHMNVIVGLTSLLGVALTIHFAVRLSSRMWESSRAGLFAGLLVGSHWVLLWSSTNPMAEVFFWPALLAGLNAWLIGWQAHADGHHGHAHSYFLKAAAWVAFGTMFRYEMWYVGMVLGVFLGMRALALALGRDIRDQQEVFGCLAGCALVAAYPLAWMVSSQVQLGSLLAFLDNAREQHLLIARPDDNATQMSLFLTYPSMLIRDHGAVLALGVFGMIAAPFVGPRRSLPMVLALLCTAIMGMLVSVRSGIASATPERLTVFLVLPLLCLAAGPLAMIWNPSRQRLERPLRIAVASLLVLIIGASTARARLEYPGADGVRPEFLGLMTRLEREADDNRAAAQRIRLPDGDLAIYYGSHVPDFWMAAHHSLAPERVYPIHDVAELQLQFDEAAPRTHLLVRKPLPDITVPPHVRLLDEMPQYELWEVGDPNP